MAVPWQYHGSTMAVPWQYHGSTMAVPWQYRGSTAVLKINTFVLPQYCHGTAAALWDRYQSPSDILFAALFHFVSLFSLDRATPYTDSACLEETSSPQVLKPRTSKMESDVWGRVVTGGTRSEGTL